jgi:prepilin-type N-terminal cleavage/methylation domain-containing protein
MFARRISGFTLVELLVSITIIGMLISLMLPAIQAAREAARQMSCSNNLKQIGLGLHLYHQSYQQLPAGWLAYNSQSGLPDPLGPPGWGWASQILPFIEQGNVSRNLLNFDKPLTAPENAQARTQIVALFRCPSDVGKGTFTWRPDRPPESGGVIGVELATSNYLGVYGTTDIHQCGETPSGQQCMSNGIFYHNSSVRFEDITDGLSKTFLVGERTSELDYPTWIGAPPGDECAPGLVVGTASYPPNSKQSDIHNFSSRHPSGTNFLSADGSVRLVSQTIDRDVYHALCTRAGRDIVPADALSK